MTACAPDPIFTWGITRSFGCRNVTAHRTPSLSAMQPLFRLLVNSWLFV